MKQVMVGLVFTDDEVLGPIVVLILIYVMHDFWQSDRSAQRSLGDE